ncbi:MAG: DUF1330 domain-containing protein [Colwellia sp.]|nr:DUF1330 domain-containing protein [Colwellia sp.]
MSYEILVGLNVLDELKYDQYRAAMKPILSDFEGHFGYDFKVSDVLISAGNTDINRVFTINFSSKNKMESFFSDRQYLDSKEKYFVDSVGSTTIISSYEKLP